MLRSLAPWGLMPWNDAMEFDIGKPDSLELDSIEPDTGELDAWDLYGGPEVLCQNLLVWAPLS
jgi:hypothetical protein